jgi:hypothetical protein
MWLLAMNWEQILPLIITVTATLLGWGLKLLFTAIVSSIKSAIIREVKTQLEHQGARIEANTENITKLEKQMNELITLLIKRNT